jgi:low affinity Fe/Cu permease
MMPWRAHIQAAFARWSENRAAMTIAFGAAVAALATGPFFDFSSTWQMVITSETAVLMLMGVLLIHRAQNGRLAPRDEVVPESEAPAVHAELDVTEEDLRELIRAGGPGGLTRSRLERL